MNRRVVQQTDSLEMLLDTMCNTFGGIILIALLIALLARDAKVSEAGQRRLTESSGFLLRQLEQAEKDLTRARTFRSDLERRVTDPAQVSVLKLIEQREELRRTSQLLAAASRTADQTLTGGATASQARISERISQMNAENQASERELTERRNLGASLLGRLAELKRGMQEESNRLAQVIARQVQRLRLPHERETTKTSVINLIVRYGRVYPVKYFSGGGVVTNTTSLRWQPVDTVTSRLDPVPGQGLNPETDAGAIEQLLRDVPGDLVYLVFQVYEDSFGAFNTVKRAAVNRRLDYGWKPRRNEEVMTTGGAGEAPPRPQ